MVQRDVNFYDNEILKRTLVSINVPLWIYESICKIAEDNGDIPISILMKRWLMNATYKNFEEACENVETLRGLTGKTINTYLRPKELDHLKRFSDKLRIPINQMVKTFFLYKFSEENQYKTKYKKDPKVKKIAVQCQDSFKTAILRIKNKYDPKMSLSAFMAMILSMPIHTARNTLMDNLYKTKRKDTGFGNAWLALYVSEADYKKIYNNCDCDLSAQSIRNQIAYRISIM